MYSALNPANQGSSVISLSFAKKIENGNQLLNINSYEYLLQIYKELEKLVAIYLVQTIENEVCYDPLRSEEDYKKEIRKKFDERLKTFTLPDELFPINTIYEIFKHNANYNPTYAYGDFYSSLILNFEEHIKIVKSYIAKNNAQYMHFADTMTAIKAHEAILEQKIIEEENDEFIMVEAKPHTQKDLKKGQLHLSFIKAIYATTLRMIYANPNQALERTHEMVKTILEDKSKSFKEIDKALRVRINTTGTAPDSKLNRHSPGSEEEFTRRLWYNTLASTVKTQATTNMASIRQYNYKQHRIDLPIELRFGTMGEYHERHARINPLFEGMLEVQKLECKDMENTTDRPRTRITHIYFNNLGRDRFSFSVEGQNEAQLTQQLHLLENTHDNIAVITLPADKGLMDYHFITDHHQTLPKETIVSDILAIAKGINLHSINDFYISPEIKKLLYGIDPLTHEYNRQAEETHLTWCIEQSFIKLGLYQKTYLSHAEMQAVYFHFIKYELTDFILHTLNPVSFNISCKDAIDRGGVASTYYNLIKSLEEGELITEAEFHRALFAAPLLVKGRGINKHADILWNTVDKYIDNSDLPKNHWLCQWRDRYAPTNTKLELLQALIKMIDECSLNTTHSSKLFNAHLPDQTKILKAAIKLQRMLQNGTKCDFTRQEYEHLSRTPLDSLTKRMLETGYIHLEQIKPVSSEPSNELV